MCTFLALESLVQRDVGVAAAWQNGSVGFASMVAALAESVAASQ
jgi:hypothetical protein